MADFSNLTWEDMEHLVGKLFEKKGYEIHVTKRTGDFGIDVEAKNSTEFIGIQVKHWSNDVGFDDCAKTLGVSHQYNKAIIISTKSGFTPQAWRFQKENQYRLELWDSSRFKKELLMNDLNISSNSIPIFAKPKEENEEDKLKAFRKIEAQNQKSTKREWTKGEWAGMTLLLITLLILVAMVS